MGQPAGTRRIRTNRLTALWLVALLLSLVGLLWPNAKSNAAPNLPTGQPYNLQSTVYNLQSSTPKSSSNIQLSLDAGIDGYARGGSWLPLYLNLNNGGPNLTGELVISLAPGTSVGGYNQARPLELYSSLYVQPLELASGARKGLTMYIPLASYDLFNQTVRVELRGSQGDGSKLLAAAEAQLKQLLNQALVGVLSPTPDDFQPYDGIVIGQPQLTNAAAAKAGPLVHFALARLDAAHLPSIGQAFGSLNALVVKDFDLSTLSPAQLVALESWVRSGGYLIISGGASAERSLRSLPASLRSVALPGPGDSGPLEAADVKALEKLGGASLPANTTGTSYLAHLTPVQEATVGLKGGQWPLLITLRRGSGAVVTTAFDLSEKRFSGWDGTSALWDNLLASSQQNLTAGNIYSAYGLNASVLNGGVTSILTNIPGVGIPSLKIIALLALVYIIIVGPVNYLVLRRLGRREWSWFTLPALTLLFVVGIYLFALRDKGTDVITSSVNIVRLDARDAKSGPIEKSALGMIGVFAPTNNSYVLGLPSNSLVSAVPSYLPNIAPAGPIYGNNGSSNGYGGILPTPVPQPVYQPPVGLRIVQGDQPQVDLLGMSQWSFRSVVVEGTVRLEGGIISELSQRDGRIQGQITNRTGQTLKDVTVISSFGYFRVSSGLPNGASAPVDFVSVFGQPSNIAAGFKGISYGSPYGNYAQSGLTSDERNEARKRDLLSLMYSSLPNSTIPAYSGLSGSGTPAQVTIVGWLEQPLLGYKVNGRSVGGNDLTMLLADTPIDPARSTELLPGAVRGQVVDKQETPITATTNTQPNTPSPPRPATSPQGASLEVGQVTVDFDLSGQLTGRTPSRLVLETPGYVYRKNPYGAQPSPRYAAQLYNFKTSQWQIVPVVVAPSACLDNIPAYQGGPVTAPISSLNLAGVTGRANNQLCQSAALGNINGPGFPPTPTVAQASRPATTGSPTPARSASPTTNAATLPTLAAVSYAGGPADNFVVLADGPNFGAGDFVGPNSRVRTRFVRDASVTDIMYWYYFTIGYRL